MGTQSMGTMGRNWSVFSFDVYTGGMCAGTHVSKQSVRGGWKWYLQGAHYEDCVCDRKVVNTIQLLLSEEIAMLKTKKHPLC